MNIPCTFRIFMYMAMVHLYSIKTTELINLQISNLFNHLHLCPSHNYQHARYIDIVFFVAIIIILSCPQHGYP